MVFRWPHKIKIIRYKCKVAKHKKTVSLGVNILRFLMKHFINTINRDHLNNDQTQESIQFKFSVKMTVHNINRRETERQGA